jgi:hypothetical protein
MLRIAAVCSVILLGFANLPATQACPFCTAVKQTLRQDIESMDAVAIGQLIIDKKATPDVVDGSGKFRVTEVIKGDSLMAVGDEIEVPYFGANNADRKFLLMGVDPQQLLWSSPLPLSDDAEAYIGKLPNLPSNPVERLKFHMAYLQHEDTFLNRDAYDEFALTPYDQLLLLKPDLDREQLIGWIQDDSLSPERKRLYLTLLGICGTSADADLLVERLKSDDAEKKAGLDAMIACYLTLKGNDGLPLIVDQFLSNKKSQYSDTYSAIMALRFHGTEGKSIDRDKIVEAMHAMLERPQLADLVIPDLARWSDWSQIDRMITLFKEADDENSWIRVPVINYLRACPKPEAEKAIAELEKIDPKAVKRAKTFFPIPRAKPGAGESSSILPALGSPKVFAPQTSGTRYASRSLIGSQAVLATTPAQLNRSYLAIVLCLFCSTIGIMMWFIMTGTGRSHVLAPVRVTTPSEQERNR